MLYRYMILSVFCFIPLLSHNLSRAEERPPGIYNPQSEEILTRTEPGKKKLGKFIVKITNNEKTGYSFFQPRILTVQVGDTVSWVNDDSHTHFVTYMKENYPRRDYTSEMDDEEEENSEKVDNTFFSSSDIEPGKTFTHSFNQPGIYKYFCFPHPIDMQGTIVVNE